MNQSNEEVALLEMTLDCLDPKDPDVPYRWIEYGEARWLRHCCRRHILGAPPERHDVEAAIDAFDFAFTRLRGVLPPAHEGWLAGTFAEALVERQVFDALVPDDLRRAIDLMEYALDLLDVGSEDWFERGESLAGLLLDRFRCQGDAIDVHRAITVLGRHVGEAGRRSMPAGFAWSELGYAYATRYGIDVDPADRDAAIDAFDRAIRAGEGTGTVVASYTELLADRDGVTDTDIAVIRMPVPSRAGTGVAAPSRDAVGVPAPQRAVRPGPCRYPTCARPASRRAGKRR